MRPEQHPREDVTTFEEVGEHGQHFALVRRLALRSPGKRLEFAKSLRRAEINHLQGVVAVAESLCDILAEDRIGPGIEEVLH